MIDYPAARAVAMIVQTGSFEGAARALNVTPSAISQRVRQLEERLGAVLIDRGVPCTATEKGAWLCRHMEHVGMLETGLMEHLPGLRRSGGAGAERVTLNVATNADSLGTWFLSAAAAFTDGDGLPSERRRRRRGPYRRLAAARPGSGGGDVAGEAGAGLPRHGARQALRYHATASPDVRRAPLSRRRHAGGARRRRPA